MPATNRYGHFKDEIIRLLETQGTVRVEKMDNSVGTYPYCWAEAWGPDDYKPVRDETGTPVLDDNGKATWYGSCAFTVWAKARIEGRDTAKAGLLEAAGQVVIATLEDALKYGGTVNDLTTDDFDLLVQEITPSNNWLAYDDSEQTMLVRIVGTINYIQQDK